MGYSDCGQTVHSIDIFRTSSQSTLINYLLIFSLIFLCVCFFWAVHNALWFIIDVLIDVFSSKCTAIIDLLQLQDQQVFPVTVAWRETFLNKHKRILVESPDIRLHLLFSYWFWTQLNSVWFKINRKMVKETLFYFMLTWNFMLTRINKKFHVTNANKCEIFTSKLNWYHME